VLRLTSKETRTFPRTGPACLRRRTEQKGSKEKKVGFRAGKGAVPRVGEKKNYPVATGGENETANGEKSKGKESPKDMEKGFDSAGKNRSYPCYESGIICTQAKKCIRK